jgi:hypothetical protein
MSLFSAGFWSRRFGIAYIFALSLSSSRNSHCQAAWGPLFSHADKARAQTIIIEAIIFNCPKTNPLIKRAPSSIQFSVVCEFSQCRIMNEGCAFVRVRRMRDESDFAIRIYTLATLNPELCLVCTYNGVFMHPHIRIIAQPRRNYGPYT